MSGENDPFQKIISERPQLFSQVSVSISRDQFLGLEAIIKAAEEAIKNPSFQNFILPHAPIMARPNYGPHGVFMGYDFHLTQNGPQLIEINTNAGGGLINLELARHRFNEKERFDSLEKSFYEMFQEDWKAQRGDQKLQTIVIVDDKPSEQFLYPEFKLFEKLFNKFGLKASIADPDELLFSEGVLTLRGEKIDLVYNRLTDFYLSQDTHAALREGYESGAVVLTPSPHHHALYANKINLITLTDPSMLEKFNLPESVRETLLKGIPKTKPVCKECANELWEKRKNLFFKPAAGFGSKATYRGDKVTHRVWEEMLQGEYVAQEFAPPGEETVDVDGQKTNLKVDIRAYVYQGQIQLLAARLYSGQTTNFRTPGGGFAPVRIADTE